MSILTIVLSLWWMLERTEMLSYARPIGGTVAETYPTGLGSSIIPMELEYQVPDGSRASIVIEVTRLYV